MDVMGVLPPLLSHKVERLKCHNTERERVMEQYPEERVMLETKLLDLCKPIYEDIGNVVAICLYDETKSINNEGGGKKEEEGLKRDDEDSNGDMGEGEEREGVHPWRTPSRTTRYTAPSPPEVLLLLRTKPPRTTMTKRGT